MSVCCSATDVDRWGGTFPEQVLMQAVPYRPKLYRNSLYRNGAARGVDRAIEYTFSRNKINQNRTWGKIRKLKMAEFANFQKSMISTDPHWNESICTDPI